MNGTLADGSVIKNAVIALSVIGCGLCLTGWKRQTAAPSPAASCMSNEKQIATGIIMYVQDNDMIFPRKNAPYNKLIAPFVKNDAVFTCPQDAKGTVSYTFNANMQGATLASVSAPAQTVLLYEGRNMQLTYRHNGRAAVGFVDGHVRLVSPEGAKNLFWYPTGKTPVFNPPTKPAKGARSGHGK